MLYRMKQLMLLGSDLVSYAIGLWLALAIRDWILPTSDTFERHIATFAIVFALWIVINYINGLYDLDKLSNKWRMYRRYAETAALSLIAGFVFFYLFVQGTITPKTILVLSVIFGYSTAALFRTIYNAIVGSKRLQTNVLFIGVTPEMKELNQIMTDHAEKGYTISAWIDPEKELEKKAYRHLNVYDRLTTIRPAITEHNIDLVVVPNHLTDDAKVLRELYELLFWDVKITNMAAFYETITGRIPPSTFSESWFLRHLHNRDQPFYDHIKTLVDYLFGLLLSVLLAIFVIPVALLIKLDSRGPIFYKQHRVGIHGKQFLLYKFRSMKALTKDGGAETDGAEFAQKGDKRITRVGWFLRKTRLDELPQAVNILKRDITLIGPRPERPEITSELEKQMPYYPLRHTVRPGLTGWAVIHQNYADSMESSLEKLQYDLYYIKNRSILLDLSILLRTVNVVLRMMGQ